MFLNMNRIYIYIYFFLAYKTLIAIVTSFISIFSKSSFSDGIFIPSQLYYFVKGLIFVTVCASFIISSWFNSTVTVYWKHLLSFLLMGFTVAFLFFYPIRRIYIWSKTIRTYLLRFIITDHNQRQTHYFSLIPSYFDVYF